MDAIVTPARRGPATVEGDVTAHDPATPLWQQVYTGLRSAIETGRYSPESRLPSESELCRKYGVSRPVVRRAIAELRNEGLVATIKGSGAFVTDGRLEDDFVGTRSGFFDEMTSKGRQLRTHVLAQGAGKATAKEAQRLELRPGDPVVRLERLRYVNDVPTLLVWTTLPGALVPGLEEIPLENASLYATLRERYGLLPYSAERWLEAIKISPGDAWKMSIEPDTPVLGIESVVRAPSRVPIEYYYALQRTDVSRVHLTINGGS